MATMKTLNHNVRREGKVWGATVWFGSVWVGSDGNEHAQNVRRYYYWTRAQARAADISDCTGRGGCVGMHGDGNMAPEVAE